MSMAPRCDDCLEFEHRCRCAANPNPALRPGGLEPFEIIPREQFLEAERRFREKGGWL
jgi:hypothetical protein